MRPQVLARWIVLPAIATFLTAAPGRANEQTVPIALQLERLDRVVRLEWGYSSRGDTSALVVVVPKEKETASSDMGIRFGLLIGGGCKRR